MIQVPGTVYQDAKQSATRVVGLTIPRGTPTRNGAVEKKTWCCCLKCCRVRTWFIHETWSIPLSLSVQETAIRNSLPVTFIHNSQSLVSRRGRRWETMWHFLTEMNAVVSLPLSTLHAVTAVRLGWIRVIKSSEPQNG